VKIGVEEEVVGQIQRLDTQLLVVRTSERNNRESLPAFRTVHPFETYLHPAIPAYLQSYKTATKRETKVSHSMLCQWYTCNEKKFIFKFYYNLLQVWYVIFKK
jgi:hypothetical protein